MILFVASEGLGQGDEALGKMVMEKFFMTLTEAQNLPEKIFFYNTGVRLCGEDSPVETYLEALHGLGVDLVACSTSTNHLGIPLLHFIRAGSMQELVGDLTSDETIRRI